METLLFSKHMNASDIKINDSFWREKLELVRKEVIPISMMHFTTK